MTIWDNHSLTHNTYLPTYYETDLFLLNRTNQSKEQLRRKQKEGKIQTTSLTEVSVNLPKLNYQKNNKNKKKTLIPYLEMLVSNKIKVGLLSDK